VTLTGRIIGSLMLIGGVGLFGVFTGYVARIFLTPRREDEGGVDDEEAVQPRIPARSIEPEAPEPPG
jgi:voltage-gated potassium channel